MTREKTIRSAVIPPPVGGWNTRDPISQMDSTFATELINLFPQDGVVTLRNGRTRFGTASSGGVLHTFRYGSYDKLIQAGIVLDIRDMSSGGAGTDIRGGAAINGGFFYSQQFKDRIFLNSTSTSDDVYHWTGTGNIAASAFTGPSGDDKTLGPIAAYKNRLYFASLNSLDIWYANYDSITGALTQYPVDALFKLGGLILFMGSVTRAKDFSEDELFCAVSSEGEVLLFQGNSPASTSWEIIGRYNIPKPLGVKAFFYLGSTLMIITSQGILPIDTIMGGNFSSSVSSVLSGDISALIRAKFTEAAQPEFFPSSGSIYNHRWNGCNYPRANMLVINIPTTSAVTTNESEQYVMNSLTGAWCKFTGWSANHFAIWQDRLYSVWSGAQSPSVSGAVFLCDDGYVDYDSSNATVSRTIKMRPAYNFFGDPSHKKRFLFAVPHMYQSEGMQLTIDADVDFKNVAATQVVTPDNADTSYKYYSPTVGLAAVGKCASIRIDQSVTTKRMELQAIEVFWETGSVL